MMRHMSAAAGPEPSTVLVPAARWARWRENFERSHGTTTSGVEDDALVGRAADGSHFAARMPFDRAWDDAAVSAAPPEDWAVLLVRKGGFAIARLAGTEWTASKTGQRHVQGRTKAGGQSQQRFARRRDNQARQAFEAAADHAVRLLGDGAAGSLPTVTGGDRAAVEEVLTEPRLRSVAVVGPWLAVPDPRRAVLEKAVLDAQSLMVTVVNAG